MADHEKSRSRNNGDIESEVRARRQSTVSLVGSARAGSTGLRTIIQESPDLSLIAEVTDRSAAVPAARQHHPDHILVAGDGITQAQLVLLRELRRASVESSLIVCTERCDRETVIALGSVPVDGIVAWADVTANTLHDALALVPHGLHVLSAHAVEALVRPAEPEVGRPTISELERRIIRGLDEERGEHEIGEAEAVSPSTVRRTVKSLKAKLGVRTLYWVGRMVERLKLSE